MNRTTTNRRKLESLRDKEVQEVNWEVCGRKRQSRKKDIAPGPREGCEGYIRKKEMLRRGWPLPKRDTDKESYQCRFNYYSIYLIFFNFFIVKQQKSGDFLLKSFCLGACCLTILIYCLKCLRVRCAHAPPTFPDFKMCVYGE